MRKARSAGAISRPTRATFRTSPRPLQPSSRSPNRPTTQGMRAVIASLPRGKTLPPRVWARRHRTLVWLVWAHAVALPLFGLAQGYGLGHVLLDALPIAFFGGAAMLSSRSQRFRACMVSMGLLTSSAILVHLWGGQIE